MMAQDINNKQGTRRAVDVPAEWNNRFRRGYHTTHRWAEQARQTAEERLELVRSGELERRKLLAQARKLQGELSTASYRLEYHGGRSLEHISSMPLPETSEQLRAWIEHGKIMLKMGNTHFQEIKLEEARRIREQELETEEQYKAQVSYLRDDLLPRLRGSGVVEVYWGDSWYANALARIGILSHEEAETISRAAESWELYQDRFERLLDEHEHWDDQFLLRMSEEEMWRRIYLEDGRPYYRKRHRRGYDPDRRKQWRRETRRLKTREG